MNRSVSVGVVVLVVAVFVAGIGVPMTIASTGAGGNVPYGAQQTAIGTDTQAQPQPQTSMATTQDFDTTTFEITVHENGSATWTFQHHLQFDSDNETEEREAFEKFAEEFESEETELYERFTNRAQAMTESGAETTGREMEATNFERSAKVSGQLKPQGIVEMSFTWEGFAEVEDDTVTVGDVFQDIYIGPDQTIVIKADDGLTFDRIEPASDAYYQTESLEDASSVRWSGEQQFFDGHPHAVLVQRGATDTGSDSFLSSITDGNGASWNLAVGVIVLLVIVGGGVWYRRRGTTDGSGDDGPAAGTATQSSDGAAVSGGATAGAEATPPPPSPDGDGDEDVATESTPLPDEELLTDEDRVVRLIRENGGRMKQVNIVEETGWSKSKVSMLLSDMEEDGTISKLRVGRENIISLEGFEPEATKSPFDE